MCDFDDDSLDEDELDELIGLTELYESLDSEAIDIIEDIIQHEEDDAWSAVDADSNAKPGSPTGTIEDGRIKQ